MNAEIAQLTCWYCNCSNTKYVKTYLTTPAYKFSKSEEIGKGHGKKWSLWTTKSQNTNCLKEESLKTKKTWDNWETAWRDEASPTPASICPVQHTHELSFPTGNMLHSDLQRNSQLNAEIMYNSYNKRKQRRQSHNQKKGYQLKRSVTLRCATAVWMRHWGTWIGGWTKWP